MNIDMWVNNQKVLFGFISTFLKERISRRERYSFSGEELHGSFNLGADSGWSIEGLSEFGALLGRIIGLGLFCVLGLAIILPSSSAITIAVAVALAALGGQLIGLLMGKYPQSIERING